MSFLGDQKRCRREICYLPHLGQATLDFGQKLSTVVSSAKSVAKFSAHKLACIPTSASTILSPSNLCVKSAQRALW